MVVKTSTDYGPTRADGSLSTTCPECGAKTTAHKHVIECWQCSRPYRTGKSEPVRVDDDDHFGERAEY